ncbi:MAG: DUF1508 domain-containing protein [bacterium]|nr:DUF1508 domain-containing protein [bacterium]
MIKFEIFRDIRGQYRWRLKAANGEIIAVSEGYVYKLSAKNSVAGIKSLAPHAIVVDLTTF